MSSDRTFVAAGRRRLAALTVTAIVVAAAAPLVLPATAAFAQTNLLTESFTNATLNNAANSANFSVVGNAAATAAGLPCLTAATANPQTGTPIPICSTSESSITTGGALQAGGDGAGSGALRLTDTGTSEKGALIYNKALPLSGGADISFDFAMYGGTGSADGINFFLADGANSLDATGASGGSLGYAQKTSLSTPTSPGVTNGFLGLGLDEFGNYELDTEGRGTSGGGATTPGTVTCPQTPYQTQANDVRTANQIGLRGPGSGYNGYCLLNSATLSSATQSLHGGSTSKTGNHLTAGNLETARITVDPSTVANPMVTVYLATNQTATDSVVPTEVFQTPEPANAPSTFRFGVAASTGGSTDVHEILNLSIKDLSSAGTKPVYTIAQSDNSSQVFDAGSTTGSFTITPTLSTTGANETVAPVVTETLPTGLTITGTPTATGYSCTVSANKETLTCTYTGALPITAGKTLPSITVPVTTSATATGQLPPVVASIASTDSNTATADDTVSVAAAPVAVTDSATVSAYATGGTPTTVTLPVVNNDTGSQLTVTAVTAVTAGTLGTTTVSADGKSVVYTPEPGVSGTDTFTYTITDPRGETSSVKDTVTITPGVPDFYATPENTKVTTTTVATGVLGNDVGATLAVTGVNGGTTIGTAVTTTHGSVTVAANGTFTYTPTTNFTGTDTFTYNATSGGVAYGPITVTIVVGTKPIAPNDSETTTAGTAVTVAGYSKATYETGATFTNTTPADGGVTAGTAKGTFVYTPKPGFSGTDSFTYTITNPGTDGAATGTETILVKPVGADDPDYKTAFNTPLTVTSKTTPAGLLSNDTGTGLTVVGVDGANALTGSTTKGGQVAVNSDGTFTYTPAAGYVGADTFTYTATDGFSVYTQTATVTVAKPAAPVANPESFTTTAVPATATSGNSVTLAVITNALGGTDTGTGTLTPVIGTQPKNGKAVVTGTGTTATITYTANPGFSGSDPFTYEDTDAYGSTSNVVTEPVTVTPVAVNDAISTTFPAPVTAATATLTANDAGSGLTVTSVSATSTAGGTVKLNGDGTYTYTPPTAFPASGTDSFTYVATDSSAGKQTATATVNVTLNKPTAPMAANDAKTTTAGPATGTGAAVVLAGSTKPGTSFAAGSKITNTTPTNGTLTAGAPNANGAFTYTYTPKGGFSGTDSFTYTITDPTGQTATGTESVTVLPVANTDGIATTLPVVVTAATSSLTANDFGTGLTVTSVGPTTNGGTVTLNGDGTYTYAPPTVFPASGTDSFTYTATDTSTGKLTATSTVTVTLTEPALVVPNASASTTAGPSTGTGVAVTLAGSSKATYEAGSKITNTTPGNGTVVANADGTYTYTPKGGFSGTDSFTYTVTDPAGQTKTGTESVTVRPVAENDGIVTTLPVAVTAATSTLTANDFGSGLTVIAVGPTTNGGTVTLNGDGTYTYTPPVSLPAGGTDTFTYTAADTSAAEQTATATVTVTLKNPAAPVARADTFPATTAVAGTAAKGNTSVLNVVTNTTPNGADTGTGKLTVSVSPTSVSGGTETVAADGQSVTYVAKPGYSGIDTFTYTVTDPQNQTSNTVTDTVSVRPVGADDSYADPTYDAVLTVPTGNGVLVDDLGTSLTVTGVNGSPSSLSGTTVLGGSVTVTAAGGFTYTPSAAVAGTDSFTYTAKDGSGQAYTQTVTITVPKPSQPVAKPDSRSTTAGKTAGAPVTLNGHGSVSGDSFAAGSTFTNTTPAHGSVTANTDGTYTYTPAGGFSGTDTFTYTVTDFTGQAATATETVTVVPVANPDSESVVDGSTVTATVPAPYGLAPAAGSFTFTVVTPPADATASGFSFNGATGAYSYTPKVPFTGSDTFTYTVTGAGGTSAAATVTLKVTAPPAATAVPDAFSTTDQVPVGSTTGTPVAVNVIGNDTGKVGTVNAVVVTPPKNGVATVSADGQSITYTPNAGFSGSDPFTYADVQFGVTGSPVTEPVTVTPFATNDAIATTLPTPVKAQGSTLTANDEGSGLTVTAVGPTTNGGTVVLNGDGTYTYTPPATLPASGTDTFTYTATDTSAAKQTTTATVTVTLTDPAPPVANADTFSVVAVRPGNPGSAESINVVTNPGDATGVDSGTGPLTVTVTQPAHGTVTVGADKQTVIYTAPAGFSGQDPFLYTLTDGAGQTTTVTEKVTVLPKAANDAVSTPYDTPVVASTATLTSNDAGSNLTVTGVDATSTAGGKVMLNANGTFTYTPPTAYPASGTDSFTYTATDGTSTTTATVIVTLTKPTPPKAVDDVVPGPVMSGTPVTVGAPGVLGNDSHPAPVTISYTQPASGLATVAINGDGSYVYSPSATFSGKDSFTYTLTDPTGQASTATVTVTVLPVGLLDTPTTAYVTPVTFNPTANDKGAGDKVTTFTQPPGGTVVKNADGTLTYTPKAGTTGTDTFTYNGVDAAGQTYGPINVTVTVNAPGAPVAVDDTLDSSGKAYTTPANPTAPLVIPVTANDTGVAALIPTVKTQTPGSTVTVNADDTISYTPPAGFSGTDTFTYSVTDPAGQKSNTATVTIQVTPTAAPYSTSTPFNQPVTIASSTLIAGAVGTKLSVTSVTSLGTTTGSAVLSKDGSTITYTPASNDTAPDTFTYTVTDQSGKTATSTITVNIVKPTPPTAQPQTASTTAGTPITPTSTPAETNLLTGSTGTTDTVVPQAGTKTPAGATVVVKANGSYTYTPAAGFSGTDTFTYVVTDAAGQQTAPQTVTVKVAPVALDDTEGVTAGATLSTAVPTGVGSGALTYTLVALPTHATGQLSIDPKTGAYAYTPDPSFIGTDSFTYTVTDGNGFVSAPATVTIKVAAAAPPTANPDSSSALSGGQVTGNVVTNDASTDGPITVPAGNYSQPAAGQGSVTLATDGTYVYMAPTSFSGTTTFIYTPVDAAGQPATTPGTVTIKVAPVALPGSATTPADTPVTVTLPAPYGSDITGYTVTTDPTKGTLTPTGTPGIYTFTPTSGVTGSDSFTYTVTGDGGTSAAATVSITIGTPAPPMAVDDGPYAVNAGSATTEAAPGVLVNDSGDGPLTPAFPAKSNHGGTLTPTSNGGFTYTPPTGFSGVDTFTYTVTDNVKQVSNAATVTLKVVPVATGDSFAPVGGALFASPTSLLVNDLGSPGLKITVVSQPSHGTPVTVNADGTFSYTPTAPFTGADGFTYKVTDASGDVSNVATVSLNVVAPAPPVGQADTATVPADAGATAEPSVLANDGAGLHVGAYDTTGTAGGTIGLDRATGTYTYTPPAGFSGTDTFTYTPVDAYGQPGQPVRVTVTVAPTALPDTQTVAAGATLSATVPVAEGTQPLTYAVSTTTAHGSLTLDPATGGYTYTPAAGFAGTDTFTYTASGAGGTSAPATVTLTITKPAPPTGSPSSTSTSAGTPVTGNVAARDAGFSPLTTTIAVSPVHGSVTLTPAGSYTYTPAAGFSGTDTFSYIVTDPFGQLSAPVTVTVTVTPKATPDSASVAEGTTLTGASVLANDLGSGLTAVLVTGPAHGALTLNPNGSYTYIPAAGFAGTDSFTYTANGAGGASSPITVAITVVPGTPVITGGTAQTIGIGQTPAPITFTGPTGGTLTATTSQPGALPPGLTLGKTGTFTGTATKAGTYTFPVTVTDPAGGAVTKTVTIVVTPAAVHAVAAVAATTTVGDVLKLPSLGGTIVKVTGKLPPGIKVLGTTLVGRGTKPGRYTVTTTISVGGRLVTRKVTITVKPRPVVKPTQATRPLSFTGAPVTMLMTWGLTLLVLGLGLFGFGALRMRRRQHR